MSDTPRTQSALQALFADQTSRAITAQDLRDFLVSVLNIVDHSITSAGYAILDDADAASQRGTLGLGTAAVLNSGTGNGNLILGNDTRLTDARTPTTHTHAESDVTGLVSDLAGKLSTTGNGSSVTNLNASALATGTVPTARLATGTASTATVLHGDGTWAVPYPGVTAGAGGGIVSVGPLTSDFGLSIPSTFGVDSAGNLLGNSVDLGGHKNKLNADGSAVFANNQASIDTAGNLTAASFHGDGSALTGIVTGYPGVTSDTNNGLTIVGGATLASGVIVLGATSGAPIQAIVAPNAGTVININNSDGGTFTVDDWGKITCGSGVVLGATGGANRIDVSSGQFSVDTDGNTHVYTLSVNGIVTIDSSGNVVTTNVTVNGVINASGTINGHIISNYSDSSIAIDVGIRKLFAADGTTPLVDFSGTISGAPLSFDVAGSTGYFNVPINMQAHDIVNVANITSGNMTLGYGSNLNLTAGGSGIIAMNGCTLDMGNGGISAITSISAPTGLAMNFPNGFGDGAIVMPNLPTSDPANTGQLWNNAGILTVSAG